MRSHCPPALIAFLVAGAADAADPTLHIDSVDVTENGATSDIAIAASRTPAFTLFRLTNPTRVVVDLADANLDDVTVPGSFAASSAISAITTTQFRGAQGTVGRVVIALRGDADVDTAKQAGALHIMVRAKNAAAPTATATAEESTTPVIELQGEGEDAQAHRLIRVEAKEQGAGSLVRLKTDGAVSRYEVEEVDDPTRLVVDLFGVSAKQSVVDFDGSAIAKARIGKHADKTRVVLESRGALPTYDVAATGDGLTILFGAPKSASTTTATLKGLRWEAKDGFWRLKMDVGSVVSVRTVKNAADEKVVVLDGLSASDKLLAAGLQGAGPVQGVSLVREEGKNALRVKLALNDEVEHSVWQRDGAVYWDVRVAGGATASSSDRVQPSAAPFATEAIAMTQSGMSAATYKGKKITIDLQDADIVNVIRLLGDVSGKNVIVGEEVKGRVTLKLKNVPWDQALDIVLKTKDLGMDKRGGVIRIAPQAKLDAEQDAILKKRADSEKNAPTTVRLIPVNYAIAAELIPQLQSVLSPRGKVTQDQRTNVIIVEDVIDSVAQADKLVRTLDTETPQVLIEARMVEGSTTFTRSLGIQWGGGLFFSQRGGNPTGLVFPSSVGVVGAADAGGVAAGANAPGVLQPANFAVNLPAPAQSTSGVGLNLGSLGNFGFLNARLSAAEAVGQVKVISAPRITTINNKRASINQGTDISIPTVLGQSVTVQTVKAALKLDVTPHVTADGSILLEITITNNQPGTAGAGTVSILTKEATTELLVKDGDTAVIGGIYTRNQGESFQQLPWLGSIPIIGWLFKNSVESDNRSEMLVFITPRVINRRTSAVTTTEMAGRAQ